MSLFLLQIAFVVQVIFVLNTDAICRTSYVTKCDHFDDLVSLKRVEVEDWRHLIIGDEDSLEPLYKQSLMKIHYHNFNTLKSLAIINQLNEIEAQYGLQCNFESQLDSLVLYGNIIKTIKPYMFPLFKLLKEFSLINNSIEKIEDDAFFAQSIEYLDLSHNNVEVISETALSTMKKTKIIKIVHNKIGHIDARSFPDSLEILNLDHNNLRYLQSDTFANLKNLKQLILSHNKFGVAPDMKILTKLQVLDLSYNELVSFNSSLNYLKNLEILDLSNNQIVSSSFLDSLLASKKGKKFAVSVAFNSLGYLNISSSSIDTERFKIWLYGNLWDCKQWEKERMQVYKIQVECDNKFFSSGKTPYCLNHEQFLGLFLPQRKAEFDRFLKVIKQSENDVDCKLQMEKAHVIYPTNVACVS